MRGIEVYFHMLQSAIKLNLSGVITNRGENIKYVYTDSNHADPLQRITPTKLISSEEYDKEKYLEMLLDSAEAYYQYLDLIDRSLSLIEKRHIIGGTRFIISARKISNLQNLNYKNRHRDSSIDESIFR